MQEKIVNIINEMAEYLSIPQMKKLQEVLLRQFTGTEQPSEPAPNSKFRIQKSLSIGRKLWTMTQIDAIMNMDFSTQRSL